MSIILGINAYHAGSSAALLIDGIPVIAIAEERLNRKKYYAGFPRLAINRCLEFANLKLADVEYVAIGHDSAANLDRKLKFALRNPSRLLNFAKMRARKQKVGDLRSLVSSECDSDQVQLKFKTLNVEHHLAHIASAYFASDWDEAAGLTVDGSGDFVSCLMSRCVDNRIEPIARIFVPHSLGTFYTAVCQFIGYPKYGDEGKVMGLAPLGTDSFFDFFEDVLRENGDEFELDPRYFLPFGTNQGFHVDEKGEMIVDRLFSDYFVECLGQPREPYSEITQRDMDVAFGLQRVFEKFYLRQFNLLHKQMPQTDRIALAGGCALNSVANGKALLETPFQNMCIQPAAGDDGLALGAALYASNAILNEDRRWVMNDAFLGDEFTDSCIKSELERYGVKYQKLERQDLLDRTIEALIAGKVIGWFQGRMEWGPRALGNRSILAHPGFPKMKDILNARIKHREWFRPFAPSVLAERQNDIFEQSHPSPFMLHVYTIKPEWRDRLSAVTHVDNTGRLQTVARAENELYYDLIKTFDTKTGIPVILNTSFNENEPIVWQPSDAIECFLRTKMDTLVIGPFFCEKPDGQEL